MLNKEYYKQAELMLQILPIVAKEKCFALKGGTAINFFIRNLPRYSVDIDLTFVPLSERELALRQIAIATENIGQDIEAKMPYLKVVRKYTKKAKRLVKLFVQTDEVQIKIEPNELIRGSIYPTEIRNIVAVAEQEFNSFVSMSVLSIAELYGGKLCAALDRQHPRDLFDVKLLLENEGVTEAIRTAFVVYLASHNRPINELLSPNLLDIETIYKNDFVGMAKIDVSIYELESVRNKLIKTLNEVLTDNERSFLLSLKLGEPEWGLLGIPGIEQFPAIQWKLLNVRKIPKSKHSQLIGKLKKVLKL